MRAVDLAVYADTLAAEAAALSARLDRARRRLRQAAIEHEARGALPVPTVTLLERLGVLAAPRPGSEPEEIAEVSEALAAVGRLQAWVEFQLAAAGAPDRADHDLQGVIPRAEARTVADGDAYEAVPAAARSPSPASSAAR